MPIGGKREGAGGPITPIDPAELFFLGMLNCTHEDIAGRFGCTKRTVGNRLQSEEIHEFTLGKRDPDYRKGKADIVRRGTLAEILEQGRACGRISLRRSLTIQSRTKPVAAIFLAKNILGYKDAGSLDVQHSGEIRLIPDEQLDAEIRQLAASLGVIAGSLSAGPIEAPIPTVLDVSVAEYIDTGRTEIDVERVVE